MPSTIRDTSGQDRIIARQPVWKRHRWSLIGGGIILALAIYVVPSLARQWTASESVSVDRLAVATVERGPFIRDIAAEGRVVAVVSPTLYAAAPGTVSFSVEAGGTVAEGDPLGVITSLDLQYELEEEKAGLEEKDLEYRRAKLDARRQALEIRTKLERARLDRDAAAEEHNRNRLAFERGAISEVELLRTEVALDKVKVAYEHELSRQDVEKDTVAFMVDAARLARDRKQLDVDKLRRQVEMLQLRSPVSGQIGQLLVAEHALVAKDDPIITVVDLSALEVEVKVPESFARELAIGMQAQIGSGARQFSGAVSSVSPEVIAGEVTARVRFDGELPRGLRQSERMPVRLLLDSRQDVVTVARGPFVELGGGQIAYVVNGDIAERRPVRFGSKSIDKVEILDGLAPGETVVIAGTDKFRDAERILISK